MEKWIDDGKNIQEIVNIGFYSNCALLQVHHVHPIYNLHKLYNLRNFERHSRNAMPVRRKRDPLHKYNKIILYCSPCTTWNLTRVDYGNLMAWWKNNDFNGSHLMGDSQLIIAYFIIENFSMILLVILNNRNTSKIIWNINEFAWQSLHSAFHEITKRQLKQCGVDVAISPNIAQTFANTPTRM